MIYTGQAWRLRLMTGRSLSGAASPKVLYVKPNGQTGEWTGTIDGNDIIYDVENSDILIKGVWKFQAKCTIGGDVKIGKIVKVTIDEPIL